MAVRFAWDPRKARANERRHGVAFVEAITAFHDPLSITIDDPLHSLDEERFPLISLSTMKKKAVDSDRMLKDYDFRGGVRGKYIERLRRGCNLVLLEPDVAAAFRDSRAVNRALRGVMQRTARLRRRKAPASR